MGQGLTPIFTDWTDLFRIENNDQGKDPTEKTDECGSIRLMDGSSRLINAPQMAIRRARPER